MSCVPWMKINEKEGNVQRYQNMTFSLQAHPRCTYNGLQFKHMGWRIFMRGCRLCTELHNNTVRKCMVSCVHGHQPHAWKCRHVCRSVNAGTCMRTGDRLAHFLCRRKAKNPVSSILPVRNILPCCVTLSVRRIYPYSDISYREGGRLKQNPRR